HGRRREGASPRLDPLLDDRLPERGGIRRRRRRLRQQPRPRLRAVFEALLPEVQKFHHSPSIVVDVTLCDKSPIAARHDDREASQPDTFGQQCTEAPRPAINEMWPPGNSTYSLSRLPTASMR